MPMSQSTPLSSPLSTPTSANAYVIVGAGHAARRAAETLREKAPDADIVMIGAEPELPYDRPVLSKDALLSEEGEDKAFIRNADWYAEQRITLRLGVRVESIDRDARTVQLHDGSRLGYRALLLATGSRVRPFSGPVEEGIPLHYVRTVADARLLRSALTPGKRVAVLGGGFIGLEVAASARQSGCEVVVIDPSAQLLQRSMPKDVSDVIHRLHLDKGVEIRLETLPQGIRRGARHPIEIDTNHGVIEADLVVVGIGVLPNVELASQAGLDVANGIVVDAQCRTADPAIFAAGEVTMHFNPVLGRAVRIESWQVAENQPAIAAANMLGGEETYGETPWLWSDQYDCNVQTLGLFAADQTTVTRGDPASGAFSYFGISADGRITAVATVNTGRDMGAAKRLLAQGKIVDTAKLADTTVTLRSLL